MASEYNPNPETFHDFPRPLVCNPEFVTADATRKELRAMHMQSAARDPHLVIGQNVYVGVGGERKLSLLMVQLSRSDRALPMYNTSSERNRVPS
jgi:hypothetical protein